MGMFDTFYMPDVELPNSRKSEAQFQSKSFDCNLDGYRITGDGRVTKARHDDDDRFEQWAPCDLTGAGTIYSDDLTMNIVLSRGRLVSLEIVT